MATTDSTPGTPTATSGPLPRYVPGAPPPVAPSKNQKKKRQSKLKTLAASAHDSALTDHAPDAEDIKAGKVDPSLLANPAPASSAGPDTGNNTDAEDVKPADKEKSVVVEAIAKRIKGLGKKVQRVNEYKSQTEKLNEDQKAAIAGLSNLEAGIKELEGIKKTIETLETTSRRAQAQERAEEQKANEQRVAEAAQHAEAALLPRITSLLSFLALRDLLTHATPTDLSISEPERHAILSAGDVLLAHPPLGHVEEVVKGFLSGAGSWENVDYGRLVEITSQFAAPRPGTPIPDPSIPLDPTTEHIEPPSEIPEEPEAEPAAEAEAEAEPEAEVEVEPEVVADLGLPAHATAGGGFHFMQESELDAPGMSESQEWVAVQPDAAVDTAEDEEQGEDYGEVAREAEAAQDLVATSNAAGGAPLDWAAHDEGDELPSLDSLQAKFGGSGSATPVAQPTAPATAPPPAAAPAPAPEDDGFSTIPNRRGHGTRGSFGGDRPYRSRGRGRGGFRGEGGEGGEGGGYRGRGGYRGGSGEGGDGGEGGGYRGRGGYRGGDGEGRGGYRGGDGEGRGGYRGDGEGGYRGRGRGGFGGGWGQGQEGGRGGRGGYRGGRGEGRGSGFRGANGGRGAAPGTPTAETTA